MKRLLAMLIPALLVGAVAFGLCYYFATRPMRMMAVHEEPGIAWLAAEFHLDAGQSARVQQLHDSYEPRCMEMCRKVAETNARLDRMMSAHREITPEMESALRESAELQAACRREMLVHIYAVAGMLPEGERERYLALMKPRVLAPGLPHVPTLAAQQQHP